MSMKQPKPGRRARAINDAIREAQKSMYQPPRSGPQALANQINALGPLLRLSRDAAEDDILRKILRKRIKEVGGRKSPNLYAGLVRLAFQEEDKHFLSHLAGLFAFADIKDWRADRLSLKYSFEINRRKEKGELATYDAITKEGRKLANARSEQKSTASAKRAARPSKRRWRTVRS